MIHFQISNAKWTPASFKNLVTEFLDYIVQLVEANKPFCALINKSANKPLKFYLYAPEVGGSSAFTASFLLKEFPKAEIFLIADNLTSQRLQHLQSLVPDLASAQKIPFHEIPPQNAKAEQILISVNHSHLISDEALHQDLLRMTSHFDQIIIGEGNNQSLRQVIGMLLLSPLVACICSFFVKPFRVSRLLLTYILPILPLVISWDGILALFMIRSPQKIKSLTEKLPQNWNWQSGKHPNNRGGFIIYLHGRNQKPT